MINVEVNNFLSWRNTARKLLHSEILPQEVRWDEGRNGQTSLFTEDLDVIVQSTAVTVSQDFLKLAERICHHRDSDRFNLLYQMLWRLTFENKNLLKIVSDPLTHRLETMVKAIRRDVHKTKAFVRFRKKYDNDGEEHYIAWHRPDHYSLPLSAPFFVRRFAVIRWTILTPDESAYWDLEKLHFGSGAKVSDAPGEDLMEILWKEFYRAIFNPARIKVKTMKKEMPVRHWATLPEAALIPEMLAGAQARVKDMIAHQEGHAYSATDFIPSDLNLETLSAAAKNCQGCPLYEKATQTVFGIGPKDAKLVLVGEQPGSEEDKKGTPFIGPAGEVLNQALIDVGLDRTKIYLTNAVKHFKFNYYKGKILHRSPNAQDALNCKPWLEAELKSIKPSIVVCLGLTAARSLIDPRFKIEHRGKFISKDNIIYLPTYHPSAVLRNPEPEKIYNAMVEDLSIAAKHLALG